MSAAVSVQKSALSEQYRWKTDVLSGSLKNAKCVLDVFTDVRNLQSAMAMVRQPDMDSIKIRTPEFRKYGRYSSPYRSVIRSWSKVFSWIKVSDIITAPMNNWSILQVGSLLMRNNYL